ncbi:hypothetical protein [Bradyrhizobium sp. SZCCHNRI3052]|uniref:hypothetical protein n=1 Tax=Bradyrhizobium sp. SZCCHNRI3052 TaxID=3057295 RepID=UPI002915C856|nr:hypothetical protein [Bradyrhizobium sp. SZCCHNRI3052]
MDKLRELRARVRFRLHAFFAAFICATPVLLQQLQVIDLKPLLQHYMSAELAAVVIGLLPFYIAMLQPMIHLDDRKDRDCK